MRIIKLLLSFGAKINALNSHNKTPLDLIQGPYRFYHRQGSIAKIPEISSPIDEDIFYDALGYQPTSPESKSFVRRRSSLISPVFEEVQNMVAFLKDHGAVRGREITARVCNTCSVKAFPDVSEREKKTSIESDASLNSPLQRLKMYEHTLSDDWATQIPRLFFQLSKTIEAKLYDLTHSLRHNTDESVALATQIKEMKMLRQAGSRILFLDGGGLRGLIQTEILSQLEEQTGRQITELFDWFVGTSTGGILALGFVYAKKSVKEMRQMYHRLKQEVIDKPRLGLAFNTEGFEKMLREEFGDICMNEVKHPRVLVTAVDKSCVNLKLRFFNNCFDDEYSSETVWKVARYTSAAPASFTELDNYVDGGVLANNPGSSGLTRIQNFYRSQKQRLPISLVVSVGTGREPDAELGRSDFQNFLYFGNHWFSMSDTLSSRIGNLSTLLSQAITNSDEVAENLHSRCLEQGIPCYRLDPKLKTKITMGETDDDKLIDMILQCKTNVIDQPQFASLVLQFHQCSQAVRRMSRYT